MSAEWHFLIALNEELRGLEDPVATTNGTARPVG
jgi:hypothetical protein